MTWNFQEAPTAVTVLREFKDKLKKTLRTPRRSDVPEYEREANDFLAFLSNYERLRIGSLPHDSKYLRQLTFKVGSGSQRFWIGTTGPWSCLFWIDHSQSVGVALCCFYSQRSALPATEVLQNIIFNSVLVSSVFDFTEKALLFWLEKAKGIRVT